MQNADANKTKRQANTARAKRRAKADPEASSQRAAIGRKRKADQHAAEARRMRANGYTVLQIMQSLDVGSTTVYDLLRRPYDAPAPLQRELPIFQSAERQPTINDKPTGRHHGDADPRA